jgi:predicted alpha/beta hydrolase
MIATADELHFPRTPDGWRLALHRYRAADGRAGAPVILCGGYACNRHFIDYDERHSLARYLTRRGFDAWVLELRGRGLAHPGSAHEASWRWTFDDLAEMDVPTAVDYVARATGRRVSWVGHSMGGMLLYAHLGRMGPASGAVCAGVTLAAPVAFPGVASDLLSRLGLLLLGVPFSDTIHQRWVLGALWGILGRSEVLGVGMNPDNVDRGVVGRALRLSLENVSRAKLQQFAHWSQTGEFCSVDGGFDYRAALGRVRVPLLLIAGTVDRLATPAAVALALEHLAVGKARYAELGRAHGHRADYGHVDLVLGRHAPDEVFPLVAEWLEAHGDDARAAGASRARPGGVDGGTASAF